MVVIAALEEAIGLAPEHGLALSKSAKRREALKATAFARLSCPCPRPFFRVGISLPLSSKLDQEGNALDQSSTGVEWMWRQPNLFFITV